ncbi:GATA transcription factor 15-like [Rutidosis leptorrhynchoides]|uniref:GATA transcription factor 15-like n=1 Tax=Rutidosis leptorrhynchoides TaxID=125765 RepID=UPI003A9A5C68
MDLKSVVETQLVQDEVSSKCCSDCKTTTTPLWRTGPAGPKSLCNACGIKYHKKRRAQMSGFDRTGRRKSSFKVSKQSGDLKLKVRFVFKQNKRRVKKQHQQQPKQEEECKRKRSSYERGKPWWNKLREEEQAAILLMAISCGGSWYS